MSLRNLMNQRKSALRISHPFARYDHKNQLHCTLCQPSLIKNEQLWSSHLSSKEHRRKATEYAAEQEAKAAQAAEQARLEAERAEQERNASRKRAATEEDEQESEQASSAAKKQKRDILAPPEPAVVEEEEDPDWDALEQAILAEPSASVPPPAPTATIIAQPKLIDPNAPPEAGDEGDAEEEEGEDEPKETEEERRERENKEELMQRIDDEEREQQEADQRVSALKARLAAMRKARSVHS